MIQIKCFNLNREERKMKKILFSAYSLEIGGIETALVTLLNSLINKYNITLVLEKKQGDFLKDIDKRIEIITYTPSTNKNTVLRKILNVCKRMFFSLRYKNKYDFAVSFATYSRPGSFVARTASRNNALWIHSDYLATYQGNIEEAKRFFQSVNYNKFKTIVCISERAKESFLTIFPELKKESIQIIAINNMIDANTILKKAKEPIPLKKQEITTFLHVGRHDEFSKKLTRLIEAAKILKEDGERFKILLIGEGPNTSEYQNLVKNYGLADNILFCGMQKNPYPYFKIADALILTSEFEGFPVVFNEARVLNLPIITTDVSDSKKEIEGKYGIVVEKDPYSIYRVMKQFIKDGYQIKKKFDVKEFNKNIENKIEKLIN